MGEEGIREKIEVFIDKKLLDEAQELMKTSEYKTLEAFVTQALKLMVFSEKTKSMFGDLSQLIKGEAKAQKPI